MRGGLRLLATASAVITAACAPAGAASRPHRVPCGPAGARTVAASGTARIYASRGIVLGCAAGRRPGSGIRLGSAGLCLAAERVGPAVVVGKLAAYAAERCGVDTGTTEVIVRRLSDGRQLSSTSAAVSPGPESYTSVVSLVLKADGAVAWIAVARSLGTRSQSIQVRRRDRRGESPLDSGPGIAATSLRLRGSELRWTHGSGSRSVTLS